jgi:hypothetical protein
VLCKESTNLIHHFRPGEESWVFDVWSNEQQLQGRSGGLPPPTAHVNSIYVYPTKRGESTRPRTTMSRAFVAM